MNDKTIDYYNTHAIEYVTDTENADMHECRERFLYYLKPGKRILDAGCGSGRDTIAFLKEGYVVDAFDASEELCRIASGKTGIEVKHICFEELEGEEVYDGIWACASLLHVNKTELPDVLYRLFKLLKPNGLLYASFKYGTGERSKDNRYFYDLEEENCKKVMESTGFVVREIFVTQDVREERNGEKWINTIVCKEE